MIHQGAAPFSDFASYEITLIWLPSIPIAPLFHCGKLFIHNASPVSQLQETGYKREFSAPKWLWWLSALD